MGANTHNCAILFADISGSTRLYDQLGDVQAREIVSSTLDLLFEVVHRHHGRVIKTIGDEIMCTFSDAEHAGQAACEMHEAVEAANEAQQRTTWISIRIGLHFGPALHEGGDVYGDAVNVAARMASQAKARQIVTTRATADQMSPALQEQTRFVDYAPIKGKGDVEIVEVLWQEEDLTRMATSVPAGSRAEGAASVTLRYHDSEVVLDPERRSVVLGRSPVCDMRVEESLASRQHVRVELRRDKYFIIDQSTNGTYVRDGDRSESFLRREEMPLTGDAEISLGRAFDEEPSEVVRIAYRPGAGT